MARDLAARAPLLAGLLFVSLWLLVVADLGLHALVLKRVAETILALLMIFALLRASSHIRVLAAMLILGTAALAWRAGDWQVAERGLGAALAIGAFLPVIVLLRATVEETPTVPAIRQRLSAMTGPERRAWMTGGAHLLASILTLGFISVQRPMLPDDLEPGERAALAECGIRGLGLAVVWSPFFVASAVASQLVPGVAAWQIVLNGWMLAALGAGIAHLMFNRELGVAALLRALGRLTPILVPTGLLVAAVVAISALTGWNVLQSVVVVVPTVCMAYLLWRDTSLITPVIRRVVEGAGRMGDEVLIMTASAIFGASIAGVAPPEALGVALESLAALPWLVITLEVFTIASLGFLGLHPMVSAAIIVPLTLTLQMPIANVVLSHIVILPWALSSMTAVWTLPVVMTAAAFRLPVKQLVFGRNMRFVLVYGFVACATLSALNALLN